MAKHIARIIVSVIILGTLGYAGWVFFFKPNNNEYVYEEMIAISNDLQDNEVTASLASLETKYYYGVYNPDDTSSYFVFSDSNSEQATFVNIRAYLSDISVSNFAQVFGTVEQTGLQYTEYNFNQMEVVLTAAFDYYMPYAQFVNGTQDEDLLAFKQALSAFESARADYVSKSDSLIAYQATITTAPTAQNNSVTTTKYNQLLTAGVTYYNAYANLVIAIKDYVSEFNNYGIFIYDYAAIFLNSAVSSIKYYTETVNIANQNFETLPLANEFIDVNKYLFEANYYYQRYQDYIANTTNFEDTINLNLYTQYNIVAQNYSEKLFGTANIFVTSYAEKNILLNADNSAITSVAAEYIDAIKTVLVGLGYIQVVQDTPDDGGDLEPLPHPNLPPLEEM